MLPIEKMIEVQRSKIDASLARRVLEAVRFVNRLALGAEQFRRHLDDWGGARTKEDRSPVTVADLLHQGLVQQWIARLFPGDGLICEEPRSLQESVMREALAAADRFYGIPLEDSLPHLPERGEKVTWILDPIDGTKGFLADRYYAIALGFYVDREAWFGAMAVPPSPPGLNLRISRRIGFAIRGIDAWISDIADTDDLMCQTLNPDEVTLPDPVRIAMSLEHGNTDQRVERARSEEAAHVEIVKLDSQAKYLAVALGELDVYLRDRRNDGIPDASWDHMPGALIARGAGCTVAHYDGSDIEFRPEPDIALKGGMACYRGSKLEPVGLLVQRILKE